MNSYEREMLELVKDLKDNHHVVAIKAEFEAEGSRTEELVELHQVVFRADMDLFIKIGGCEAIHDLDECKVLGATGIMAPMIETPFAMKKFIGAIDKVYDEDEKKHIEWIINAETITCLKNFNEILSVPGIESLNTIVVGRVDLSSSMGLTRAQINGNEVLEATKIFLQKAREKKIICGVGGGIAIEAIPFITQLGNLVDKFETRKVVFKAPDALDNIHFGLLKAIQFETLYLKNKYARYDRICKEDVNRIKMMEDRIAQLSYQPKEVRNTTHYYEKASHNRR